MKSKTLLSSKNSKTIYCRGSQRKTKSKKIEDHHHLVWKKSDIMESRLRLQIEKLEAKLKRYRRDNEELQDMNMKSKVIIKLHKMQIELKEQKISDQKNHIEKLSAQIEKLKDESDFNERQKIRI